MHMPYQQLGIEDGWMEQPVRLIPFPAEEPAKQRASVVAINNTIWVQHGHDPDDEVLPQLSCLIGEQIGEESIKHVGSLWLSRMYPAGQEDGFLLAMILHVLRQPLSESLEETTCLQELVLVVLEELFDLFLDRCLE